MSKQSRFGDVDVPACDYGRASGRENCDREAEYVLAPVTDDYGDVYRCSKHRDRGPLGMYGAEIAFDRSRLQLMDVDRSAVGADEHE